MPFPIGALVYADGLVGVVTQVGRFDRYGETFVQPLDMEGEFPFDAYELTLLMLPDDPDYTSFVEGVKSGKVLVFPRSSGR